MKSPVRFMARGLAEAMGDGKADTVIPGRLASANPESRDSPMRNCASEVWSFGPSRNDDKRPPVRWTMDCFACARNDGVDGPQRHQCARLVMLILPDKGAVHERD